MMMDIIKTAQRLDISADNLDLYGRDKAKLSRDFVKKIATAPQKNGKLILVTAINPTPAGEGKTTTSIGLADALAHLGKKVALCLREPSLGPCFGAKGGATGGGKATLEPADDINLHFTGDFHAITSAHNLIAALIDNALHHGTLPLEGRHITWPRVMDMNDRALRHITLGLGGTAHGVPRESGFDITTASEIMAALCLAEDAEDMAARLERMVIGWRGSTPVTVAELRATGALMALLKDALRPNLVQTAEGTPALVHGGPFANIAHGCNSVIATKTALKLADWVVTEAGFGADLGAEKFLNIKCRTTGLNPDCAVVVATIKALKYNGGVAPEALSVEDVPALDRGMPNLLRHCQNLQNFGLPVVVALNHFSTDTADEIATVQTWCKRNYIPCIISRHYAEGGTGATALAEAVIKATEAAAPLRLSYDNSLPLLEKISRIAEKVYHASGVDFAPATLASAARFEAAGYGHLPICIAKTQYSFSDDPKKLGAPRNFRLQVRALKLSAGAGFVVALAGDLLLMPGLPKTPAAERIMLTPEGQVTGLMGG